MRETAIRRRTLKRYLALCGYNVSNDAPTETLVTIVKLLHRKRGPIRHAWPMNHDTIEELSKESHIVRQLVCAKIIWGHKSSVGCVHEGKSIQCHTVADLVAIGWCSKRFLRIDDNICRLKGLEYRASQLAQ